jgi:hypothetical protein
VSWANFIKDEPEKIHQTLCVQNKILSRYLEVQLRTFHEHTTFRDIRFEDLDSKSLRVMIATFLKKGEIYTQQDLEPHY